MSPLQAIVQAEKLVIMIEDVVQLKCGVKVGHILYLKLVRRRLTGFHDSTIHGGRKGRSRSLGSFGIAQLVPRAWMIASIILRWVELQMGLRVWLTDGLG